jgi:outer membrane lipoprotein-sorting protein
MTHIPTLLALSAILAQPATEATSPPNPESTPAAATPSPAPATDSTPTESEADKQIRAAADQIDAIEFFSAKLRQTIRAGGKTVLSTGIYRRGPDGRSYFELDVTLGKSAAKRIHASDGKTGIIYEKLLDNETLQTFLVAEVIPLMESRVMTQEVKRDLLLRLPFAAPGDMLRGMLESMRFAPATETTLGDEPTRAALLYEGEWKEAMLPVVAQNGNARKIDDLAGSTPQYARIYLDKETQFPLRVELFRRDRKAEYKPIYTLEFVDVSNQRIADADFTFVPPDKVVPVDITTQLVASLSSLPAKANTESKSPAGKQRIEESLTPATK